MTKNKFKYKHERAALTTDCVLFGFDGGKLKLLLLKREKEPFKGKWALPGGFIHIDETAEESAKRVLNEKAGVKNIFIEQLFTFTDIERDPRERTISISYYALVNKHQVELIAGRDTESAEWFPISNLPKIAFDHSKIVKLALERIKGKVSYQPIGFELLNEKFSLSQLQLLYEALLDTVIDKRNFRKKILGMGFLKALKEKEKNTPHKAASLYAFDKKKYAELTEKGFHFEL